MSDVFDERRGCGGGVEGITISAIGESCDSVSMFNGIEPISVVTVGISLFSRSPQVFSEIQLPKLISGHKLKQSGVDSY